MLAWYLCPYDVSVRRGEVTRVPAMSRYIPTFPDPNGRVWDEAETLGNHLVVKVSAPIAVHATIQADPDFLVLPSGVIPVALRSAILAKLGTFGFTQDEIDRTGWDLSLLLVLLTTSMTNFQLNAAGTGIDILPGRRAPAKTVADINQRLPG